MSNGIIERAAEAEPHRQYSGYAVAPGVVTENLDVMAEGR